MKKIKLTEYLDKGHTQADLVHATGLAQSTIGSMLESMRAGTRLVYVHRQSNGDIELWERVYSRRELRAKGLK